ncbi:uncharacterized protein LOC112574713 [Pomacea canaliculata]|uniref:uncharacterized protein LOC112574713 n=1 Tax=Pomacea canaliculata TaxID=400727 RepID=UPI000D73F709|nr:uncharacterized protein LOC112574713 [Pomacea canaliculata]
MNCHRVSVSLQRPPCLWSYLLFKRFPKLQAHDVKDVTIVTAYFNLGKAPTAGKTFSLYKYLTWASVFRHLQNPLVVYTDSEQMRNMLVETRRHLSNNTLVIFITRSQLKAFRRLEEIRSIFRSPDYPKYPPNTVVAEYPCSQHAKHELVKDTIDKSYFPWTRYIAWLDIGYFRYLTERRRNFWIVRPPDMDDAKMAVTQIMPPDFTLYPDEIFKNNLVWVGGGMSVGTRGVYRQFAEEYTGATDAFLDQGLSNTDQQVLYAMFTHPHGLQHRVSTQLQMYTWSLSCVWDCWFYLGYLCYREE